MAYEEPGVKVIQQLQLGAANIAGATQALTLVGELYEVFDDEVHLTAYDPVTGAGDQEFVWPAKKSSSVVDLAGVRKSIAEIDSQLNEFAPYSLQWKLRDPSTSQVFDIDVITDVYAINQDRFKIVEGSGAATARSSNDLASAAENRKFYLSAGGLISAGVVAGDRIRLTNSGFDVRGTIDTVFDDTVFYTPDGHDLGLNAATLAGAAALVADVNVAGGGVALEASGRLALGAGATFELVDYTSVTPVGDTHTFALAGTTPTVFDHGAASDVKVQIVDAASVTDDDGDLVTTPGFLASLAGGLTGKEGSRVVLWVENLQVNDGSSAGGTNIVDGTSLGLDWTSVGKKLSIWSEDAGDGAAPGLTGDVADEGGGLGNNFVATVGTPFLAVHVGNVIKVGTDYRRVASFISTTEVVLDSNVAAAVGLTAIVYGQVVRTIMSVDGGDISVDGTALTAGTTLPLVLLRPVFRNLEADATNTDNLMRYSGSAISSDTGFLEQVQWDVHDADLTHEVFPNYELLCSFRALDTSSTNQELAIFGASDLLALGGVSPANPLAWAAQAALVAMGTSDTLIIAQPVDLFPDDDPGFKSGYPEDKDEVLGYLLALEILSMNEAVYYMVPLTQNSTVRDSFVSHCLAMSAPEEKKERICYLSYKIPLGAVESTTGTIEPGFDSGNKIISDPGQTFLSLHNIIPGNVVRITAPALYAGDYVVDSGSTEDELVLEGANWQQDSAGAYLETAKEFTQLDANFGGQTGSTASLLTASFVTTVTTAAAGDQVFSESDVGRQLTISGAADAGANGTHIITAYIDPNNVTVTTTAVDGADGNDGSVVWTVVSDNEVGIGTANGWKDVEIGDYLILGTTTRRITAVQSNGIKLYARLTYEGAALTSGAVQTVSILRTTIALNYHVNPFNKQQQADNLAAIGQARGNRRVIHMWPDQVEMITGTDAFGNDVKQFLPSYYGASAEAGRDSVIPVARSSTGLALGGFTSLLNSNFYFSKGQLNTIAGGGWAVLEQKVAGAAIQMRHLLTTDVSTVKTQEVSFTKNVDNMAKVKRASVEPLLNDEKGRINISQQFLTALAVPFQGIFENFVKEGQLVQTADAPPFKILSIRQDPTQPDTILEDVELNVPLPANRVVVTFII
jgi:hypothetical protein